VAYMETHLSKCGFNSQNTALFCQISKLVRVDIFSKWYYILEYMFIYHTFKKYLMHALRYFEA
jgi:hypothetical protein